MISVDWIEQIGADIDNVSISMGQFFINDGGKNPEGRKGFTSYQHNPGSHQR